jgi:hypothetical protein
MNTTFEHMQRDMKDLKAAIAILATAIDEQPKPLTHVEASSIELRKLDLAVKRLRDVGSNGELHEVVEHYQHEVRR